MLPSPLSRSASLPNLATDSLPGSSPVLPHSNSVPHGLNLALGRDSPCLVPLDAAAALPYVDGDFGAAVETAAESATVSLPDLYGRASEKVLTSSCVVECDKRLWRVLQDIKARFAGAAAAHPEHGNEPLHFLYEVGAVRPMTRSVCYEADKQAFVIKDVCYFDRNSIDSGRLFTTRLTVDDDSGEVIADSYIGLRENEPMPTGMVAFDTKYIWNLFRECSRALTTTRRPVDPDRFGYQPKGPENFGFQPRSVYPAAWAETVI